MAAVRVALCDVMRSAPVGLSVTESEAGQEIARAPVGNRHRQTARKRARANMERKIFCMEEPLEWI